MLSSAEAWLLNPEIAHEFFIVKGVIGIVATVLYLVHMAKVWPTLVYLDQQLRYLCLLSGAVLVTSASVEQVQDDALVNWRHLGAMVFVTLLLLAAVLSIVLDRVRQNRGRSSDPLG